MIKIVRYSATLLLSASSAAATAAAMTAVLSVPGLDCTAWPFSIKSDLLRVDGVTAVAIDLDRRRVRVSFDSATASPGKIVQVLSAQGFAATVVRLAPRRDG